MASGVNFSGIASGIDTNALIDAELASKRATRITPLEDKVTELNDTTSALTLLQTKLKDLQTKLLGFSSLSAGAVSKTSVSSDETIVTATAAKGTTNASYDVTVTQTATNGKTIIAPTAAPNYYADGTTNMGLANGTVSFNVNGTAVSVPVTTTTTAQQFVDGFNSAAGSGATAVLVNTGSSTVPNYKIFVSSTKTGLTDGALTMTAYTGLTQTATASQDAVFAISGIGSVSRSTNSVSDVVPGITFSLKAAGSSKLSIQNDSASTLTDVKEFVKLYNDVITTINDNNTVVRDESTSDVKNVFGVLAKTTTDDTILSGLRTALGSVSYSLTNNGINSNNIVNFSAMGITTDSTNYDSDAKTGGGTLKLDEDTFFNALSTEPNSVNALLTQFADLTSLTQDGKNLINNFTKSGGLLDISIQSNNDQVRDMNLRIATFESQLANEEASLKQRYASFEALTGSLQQQQSALTSSLSGLK